MSLIKLSVAITSLLLIWSCTNKKHQESVDFDNDLTQGEPMTIVPRAIEQMDFPEFDYSTIIEQFKKGERLNAAELMEDYAENFEVIRLDLKGEQKSSVSLIIDDMKLIAQQVRSKKINDADDLLAECMLIDKNIGEVFVVSEE